jgi:UrcA family protein
MSGAILLNATSAAASPSVTDQTVEVRVADLDLGTARGADEAHGRVLDAVKAACAAPRSPISSESNPDRERQCRNSAMRAADQQMRSQASQLIVLSRAK